MEEITKETMDHYFDIMRERYDFPPSEAVTAGESALDAMFNSYIEGIRRDAFALGFTAAVQALCDGIDEWRQA